MEVNVFKGILPLSLKNLGEEIPLLMLSIAATKDEDIRMYKLSKLQEKLSDQDKVKLRLGSFLHKVLKFKNLNHSYILLDHAPYKILPNSLPLSTFVFTDVELELFKNKKFIFEIVELTSGDRVVYVEDKFLRYIGYLLNKNIEENRDNNSELTHPDDLFNFPYNIEEQIKNIVDKMIETILSNDFIGNDKEILPEKRGKEFLSLLEMI